MLNFQLISQSPLFKNVSSLILEDNFKQIHYQTKSFDKNELIATQGEEIKTLKFILSGSVRAEINNEDRITKIEDLTAPASLAPSFLFGNSNAYPVNVIANENTTTLHITKEEFTKLMTINKTILTNYLHLISSKAQFLAKRINLLSLRTIKQKVATYLLEQSKDKQLAFVLPMTQTKLAEYFAVARPPLTRTLSSLEKDGIITINARTIKIINKQKLIDIANDK